MSKEERILHVLIVDDEQDFVKSASKALNRRGFDCSGVLDGASALQKLREGWFDVVVLDLKMPGLDGEEVFRRIQRDYPGLPVIMLTGHGSIPHAFQTAKKGIADYVAKPCDMDELAERIRRVEAAAYARRETCREDATRDSESEVIGLLVVDDEADFLHSIQKSLSHRNMTVWTAQSPSGAFALLKEQLIDVVVLDVRLPEMDGLEVLRRVKRMNPDIEVVLLTGFPSIDTAVEGIKQGAFAYVTKPGDIEDLARKIREAFDRREKGISKSQADLVEDIWRRYSD
jgi:two-component system OmpR family response regulator